MAHRVLFITSTHIGDCIISSGVLREIGRLLPGAEITVACGGPPAPLFRSAPGVERVIVLDGKRPGGHWVDLWRRTVGTRWDMVVDIRGSAVAWLLPARERRVYGRTLETGGAKVEAIAALMRSEKVLEPELFIDAAARATANAVIGGARDPILAFGPAAFKPFKSWPAERWGELIDRLAADPRWDGWRFMAVGGPVDHAAAAPALAAAGARGIDFIGKGDILASGAALERATLFVGNDSGVMHLSAAAGIPTLGLFGPTRWWIYGPRGPRVRVLAANPVRGELAPIEALDVDQVARAVLELRQAFAGVAAP